MTALQPLLELAHELAPVDGEHADRDRGGPPVPQPQLEAGDVAAVRRDRVLDLRSTAPPCTPAPRTSRTR